MIKTTQEQNRLIIDAREAIQNGLHPREEILNTVKQAPKGTVIEINVPHRAQPLVALLESMGLSCVTHEVDPTHFQLIAEKIE